MSESSGEQGFETVERIEAEALGEPGQRRFRLVTVSKGETRVIWLEKEQLRRLIEALAHFLNAADEPELAPPSPVLPEFAPDTREQIRAGRMEVGYDEHRNHFVIIAHDLEEKLGQVASYVCRISRQQARDLIEQSAIVISAGRPPCPLCGMPMDPSGHVCPVQNGHLPHRLGEVQDPDREE